MEGKPYSSRNSSRLSTRDCCLGQIVNLTLRIWRQPGPAATGPLVEYDARDISPDMSFLEMLDVINERLMQRGEVPIAFDHDCREGICGSCSLMINGVAHGPMRGTATCQLHMRSFKDGDTIYRRAVAGAGLSRPQGPGG